MQFPTRDEDFKRRLIKGFLCTNCKKNTLAYKVGLNWLKDIELERREGRRKRDGTRRRTRRRGGRGTNTGDLNKYKYKYR